MQTDSEGRNREVLVDEVEKENGIRTTPMRRTLKKKTSVKNPAQKARRKQVGHY